MEARDQRDALAESRLEATLLRLLRKERLPLPDVQYVVIDNDRTIARLDFAYPSVRLGIEADGYRWHGGREQWARDMRRRIASSSWAGPCSASPGKT